MVLYKTGKFLQASMARVLSLGRQSKNNRSRKSLRGYIPSCNVFVKFFDYVLLIASTFLFNSEVQGLY